MKELLLFRFCFFTFFFQKPKPQPAPVPPEGGYDDEIFLSPLPRDLKCIICLLTVRDPYLIECCGATICKVLF